MKEKFDEIAKYYARGNVLGMLYVAVDMSLGYKYIQASFMYILTLVLMEIAYAFLFAGIFYSLKKMHLKFTINPIKLMFWSFVNAFIITFFTVAYPFIFFFTLIRYGIEIIKTKFVKVETVV